MPYLITGGSGCIGSWIVRGLVAQGEKVYVYDLAPDTRRMAMIMGPEDLSPPHVNFIKGDICDYEALKRAIVENGISHIIHLAALQVPTCKQNPRLGAQVNVIGTINVFEAALECRDLIRSIVYASSAAVIGPEEAYEFRPVSGDAPLLPLTHYGVFKQCNEGNARVYYLDHGLSSIGLRPWAVYGPGRDYGLTSDPTKAMKAVVVGRSFHIKFGGRVDMQYVEDTANAFIRCSQAQIPGAKVYNLRGSVVSVDKIIETIERVYPQARGLITRGDLRIPISPEMDDSQLMADLGPLKKTSLEEGTRQTIAIFEKLYREGRLDLSDLQD